MAYILNRAYVLSQLSVLGISAAAFDAAPIDTKITALHAVAKASIAASNQITLQPQLDVAAESIASAHKYDTLCDLHIAAMQRAAAATAPPAPPT